MHLVHVDEAVQLIRMEYVEMPGLKLTAWQIRRLWNLSDDLCIRALALLTGSGFLTQTTDGAYVRCNPPRVGRRVLAMPAAS